MIGTWAAGAEDLSDAAGGLAERCACQIAAVARKIRRVVDVERLTDEQHAQARSNQERSAESQIERAFKLAYGRGPSAQETASAKKFMDRQMAIAGTREKAVTDLCHVLLNSNEFLYVD